MNDSTTKYNDLMPYQLLSRSQPLLQHIRTNPRMENTRGFAC